MSLAFERLIFRPAALDSPKSSSRQHNCPCGDFVKSALPERKTARSRCSNHFVRSSNKGYAAAAVVIAASVVTLLVTASAIALVRAMDAPSQGGFLAAGANPVILHGDSDDQVLMPMPSGETKIIADAEPNIAQVQVALLPEPEPEWKTIRMRVTAYCPCAICCGASADGVTANGHIIGAGDCFVAADQRFPFGTEIIVPGYGEDKPVPVFDRGSAIYGNRLDIFFAEHKEAKRWGVRFLDVKVKIPVVPIELAGF